MPATREQVYVAIRNADAAGDSAAVRKLGAYLKTLPAEDAAPANPVDARGSLENIAEHQRRLANAEAELADETSLPKRIGNTVANIGATGLDMTKAAGDTALTLGAGAVMTPLAGIAGAAALPFGADNAAKVVEAVQGAAYQPKSEAGHATIELVSKPFMWAAGKADKAGQVVSDVTGSPALGALTNGVLQTAPALIAPEARGAFASAGRSAGGALRAATERVAPPAVKPAAPSAQSPATAPAVQAATSTAQNYARSIGLDWDSLAEGVRSKLTGIARTAGELEKLDPEAVKRLATLQSLKVPVPATRGTITRDPGQLLREDIAQSTPEGAPIRATRIDADNALQANLDALTGRVSGSGKTAATARTPQEAGGALQGAARAKEAASKANYNKLYKAARETEPDASAPITPVTDLLTQNPEIQHLGWVTTWLNRAAKLAGGEKGKPVAITDATLKELTDLRSQASAIQRTGGKEGYYASEVAKAIDQAMEAVPAGAKAWKAANDAFKAHKTEFAEQGAIADLVDNASRTDRAVALENTVKTITNGSIEDIQKVKRTLLTGGDEATRTAGKQAWRELRRKVVENIKAVATKGAQEKADGTPNLSLAKLKQAIDAYGPEKLDEIFGPGNAREVQRILDAARIAKYQPGAIGSNTTNKIVAFLSKGLEKVPGGGKVVDVARGVAKLKDLGSNARTAESATTTTLDDALAGAARKGRAAERRRQLAGVKTTPLSSFTAGENRQ